MKGLPRGRPSQGWHCIVLGKSPSLAVTVPVVLLLHCVSLTEGKPALLFLCRALNVPAVPSPHFLNQTSGDNTGSEVYLLWSCSRNL